MKKTIPSCRLTTVLMATIFIIATSCVDERYDLTKIDKTAVILKDISMPVGNIEPLTIEDFLTVDNFESSLIRPDDKGDFALEFEGREPITVAVSVPAFDMAFEETGVEGRKVVMRMPSEIAGMDVSMLEKLMPEYYNKHISYEELTGSLASLRKTVKLNDEFILSHYIKGIKEIELNAELMYEFKLAVKDVNNSYVESPKAAMHVEKDFTIDFPDWLSIRKNDDIDAYIVENNANNKNVVRFVKDMYIPAENVFYEIVINESLFEYAMKSHVVIVSPNSFYSYLMAIGYGLKGLRIEQEAKRITAELSVIQDSFNKFFQEFLLLGKHISNANGKYDELTKKAEKLNTQMENVIQIKD